MMQIVNPATGDIIREIAPETGPELLRKFGLLQKGQSGWKQISLEERSRIILRFSQLLEDEQDSLSKILTSEIGKPLQQSRNEITGARSRVTWLATHAAGYLSPEEMFSDGNLTEQIVYEPLGVVCNISAWNYPYLVGVNVFISALLAGNSVMYKPSEYATLTGIEIDRLLRKAGIPDDVFQLAVGGRETGTNLLEIPFDGYFFTGSYKTGRYIYEKVASAMVPCQCELGGKDPLYVADDIADLPSVVAATADGAFYNNGQSCCAVERIYVHEKIYEQYVAAFVKEVKGFRIGDPQEPGVYIGPLARREQLNFIEDQIEDAVSKGAKILCGGSRIHREGFFFEPTVLVEVNHDMRVMREESFGPVIGIMKVGSDEEAVAKMNDTEYGLTAAVYSSDQDRAERILSQLDTGTAYWNCCDRVSAALPWSGRKQSGFGATLSHIGLRAFANPKAYHLKK